jgi:hypothetical protein
MPVSSQHRPHRTANKYRKPVKPFAPKPAVVEEAQPFAADLRKQIRDEIGDAEISQRERAALNQKYGLVVPLFTSKRGDTLPPYILQDGGRTWKILTRQITRLSR